MFRSLECMLTWHGICAQVSAPLQGQVALLTDAPAELSTTEAGSLLLRTGQKRFFFDTFSNAQGTFFRITEVWLSKLFPP